MPHEMLLQELLPDHAEARTLDVLDLSAAHEQLPQRNEQGGPEDVEFIVAALRGGVDRVRSSGIATRPEALSAIRDLGALLLSAARHGEHPLRGDDEAAITMGYLGTVADMVPSGSYATLALANPARDAERTGDVQRRTLTTLDAEHVFLDALVETNLSIDAALRYMSITGVTPESLTELAVACKVLQPQTAAVRRHFSPDEFTGKYRPFFDPAYIGSQRYVTPNAGQSAVTALQAVMVGHVNGQAGEQYGAADPVYRKFYMDNFPHLTREERTWVGDILAKTGKRGSILVAVEEHDQGLAEANMQVLQGLLKFRLGHYRMAAENFNLRPAGSKGGGMYDMSILDHMIEMTYSEMLTLAGEFPHAFKPQDLQDKLAHNRAWRSGLLSDHVQIAG